MALGYLTLFTALIISLSSAVYSILGLTAIFAAAFWPIVILGGSLEFGKIVTTLWLHKYWDRAEIQYKLYLCSAVAILMLLTSMGVFGFLSKAHLDQAVPSGDVAAKVQIFDDKIKTQRDNIEAARKALTQMDSAVDQTMSRSTTEQGADKAANLRRSQARERTALQNDITKAQKEITVLHEQRAPIASEMRKVEAEVGPIKYIAALVYGDNPEANTLEKAVRWVIILIVIVFDPLALTLLLAATKSLEWERGIDIFNLNAKKEEEERDRDPFEGWTEEDFAALEKDLVKEETEPPVSGDIPVFEEKEAPPLEEPVKEEPKKSWAGFSMPFGSMFTKKEEPTVEEPIDSVEQPVAEEPVPEPTKEESPIDRVLAEAERLRNIDDEPSGDELHHRVMMAWKDAHPGETFKKYRKLLQEGKIDRLPWDDDDHVSTLLLSERDRINYRQAVQLQADNVPPALETVTSFGTVLPENAKKGDLFLRVDQLPTVLYKFNGTNWIVVDKAMTDSYVYDDAYIEHLIERIEQGQYDPDLLSDAEREQIAIKLTK